MGGFQTHPTDCVILLFDGWTLDSPGAFAAGVIGTFLLGLIVELLTWTRRHVLQPSPRLQSSPLGLKAVMGLAFAAQTTLGYLLMLISMTYQAELFIAVVAGLSLGHLLFNVAAPVPQSVDACCVEVAEALPPTPQPKQHESKPHAVATTSAAA